MDKLELCVYVMFIILMWSLVYSILLKPILDKPYYDQLCKDQFGEEYESTDTRRMWDCVRYVSGTTCYANTTDCWDWTNGQDYELLKTVSHVGRS